MNDPRFALSKTRQLIIAGLRAVLGELLRVAVKGDLWIDGSFITEKIDPDDVDVVFCIQAPQTMSATPEQARILNWLQSNLKAPHLCDSRVLAMYPAGHANEWLGDWWYAYWLRQFGFSRADEPKGMVRISL